MATKNWRCPNEDDPDPGKLAGIVHADATAVDVNGLSRHIACFRAREECDDIAYLPRTANALKWSARHYHRYCFWVGMKRCYHIGVDRTGSDGVVANIVWRQSQGGGFRQLA